MAFALDRRFASPDASHRPHLGAFAQRPLHIGAQRRQRRLQRALARYAIDGELIVRIRVDTPRRNARQPILALRVNAHIGCGYVAVVGRRLRLALESLEIASAPESPGRARPNAADQWHFERHVAPHRNASVSPTGAIERIAERAERGLRRPVVRPMLPSSRSIGRTPSPSGGARQCWRSSFRAIADSRRRIRQHANALAAETRPRVPARGLQARSNRVRSAGENASAHCRQRMLQHRNFGVAGRHGHREEQVDGGILRDNQNVGRTFGLRRDDQAMARHPRRRHVGPIGGRRLIEARVVTQTLRRQDVFVQVEHPRRAAHGEVQGERQRLLRPHQMAALVGQRIDLTLDGFLHAVEDSPAFQGIAADGDAVRVEVAALHGVAEGESARRGARRLHNRGLALVFADRQDEGQIRVAGDDTHVVAVIHRRFDALAGAVGGGCGRAGGDGDALNLWLDGINAVVFIGSERREGTGDVVAGAVLQRAAPQRGDAGANANAVFVVIAGLNDIAEGQCVTAAALDQSGLTRRGTDQQFQGGRAGDVNVLAEPDLDVDVLAGVVALVASKIRRCAGLARRRGHDLNVGDPHRASGRRQHTVALLRFQRRQATI